MFLIYMNSDKKKINIQKRCFWIFFDLETFCCRLLVSSLKRQGLKMAFITLYWKVLQSFRLHASHSYLKHVEFSRPTRKECTFSIEWNVIAFHSYSSYIILYLHLYILGTEISYLLKIFVIFHLNYIVVKIYI